MLLSASHSFVRIGSSSGSDFNVMFNGESLGSAVSEKSRLVHPEDSKEGGAV